MKQINSRRRTGGFTFIEVMVVVAILAVLAALVVPRLIGGADEAKVKSTTVQIRSIETALQKYKLDNGFYPTTDQGLKALVEKPESDPVPKKWKSKYMDEIPKDPWDNEYQYISPGIQKEDSFDLWSYGPDGAGDTEDDITNWKKEEDQ